MFCAKCGAVNDGNAFRCTSCGEVLLRSGMQDDGSGLGPAPARLAQSILVTIFCCQIFGIVAIVYSALAMGQNSAGNFGQAHRYAKSANMWAWIAFGVGLLVMIPYMALMIAGAAQQGVP